MKKMNVLIKGILIIIGSVSIILGVLGIFLPLLPTTPFLLLAAVCYVKSSKKLYDWLINHKYLGRYIKNYYEKRGVPLRAKIISIFLLWLSITYSAVFVVSIVFVRVLLFAIAIGVTIHLLSLKTLRNDE